MSVIIGCVRDDKVMLATDTQRTWGNIVTHASSEYGSNIFWLPNGVAVGIAGNQAIKHAVAAHAEWFENLTGPLTQEYIVKNVIPPLYRALKDVDELNERSVRSGRSLYNGMMLLAQGNRLFCIDRDFAVITVADYCLIGHGYNYAVPRMSQYKPALSDRETENLMEQALQDAAVFSRVTSAPFRVGDTVTRTLKTIGGNEP